MEWCLELPNLWHSYYTEKEKKNQKRKTITQCTLATIVWEHGYKQKLFLARLRRSHLTGVRNHTPLPLRAIKQTQGRHSSGSRNSRPEQTSRLHDGATFMLNWASPVSSAAALGKDLYSSHWSHLATQYIDIIPDNNTAYEKIWLMSPIHSEEKKISKELNQL